MLVTSALLFLSMLFGLTGLPSLAEAAIERDLQAMMAAAPEKKQKIILHFSQSDLTNPVQLQRTVRRSERGAMIQALRQRSATAQQRVRKILAESGVSSRALWMVNALALEASPQLIARLAALPEVVEVQLDRIVRLPVRPAAETFSAVSPVAANWNLEAIGAPALWSRGLTGAGVVVASVDSGVDLAHADLAAGWRGGSNSWFDPNGQHATPFDADGHGTGTLGVILGRNSGSGVAPGASWIAVKIFNDAGVSSNSLIYEGLQWLLDPDGNPATDDAPDIVNNSWGFERDPGLCDESAREFQPVVQLLKAAGIAVVFAAGNTGPVAGSSVSPGNYPESLAVGAVNSSLQVPAFSARGPSACDGRIYPDLVAPGVGIQAPDLTAGGLFPNALQTVSGTSFAAPHLAGVMALLLSDPVRPDPPLAKLESVLKRSATDLGPIGADNAYGAGLINALAAYNILNTPPSSATLVTPLDGARELTIPVVFSWNPGADADGDLLSEALILARSADFSGATSFPLTAASGSAAGVVLAAGCGLLGIGVLRRQLLLAVALALGLLLTIVACGGGGGGAVAQFGSASLSLSQSDLQPGVTYYWKVQTSDSRGGVSESSVRTFSTAF